MSLGAKGRSVMIKKATYRAAAKNIACIVAAGNAKIDACRQSPAFVDMAITVGATDKADSRDLRYSNYGTCVDIFAPGTSIWSVDGSRKGNTDTGGLEMHGTSMATPHVSGVAAMLLQLHDGKLHP